MPTETPENVELLAEPPERNGYRRTTEIAKFLGRFDTDIAIAQKWTSDYVGRPDVWVVIPTYLLP